MQSLHSYPPLSLFIPPSLCPSLSPHIPEDEDMEEFQDTLSRCAKLEVRKRAAKMREARMITRHQHERKRLQLAQDTMYKVCAV